MRIDAGGWSLALHRHGDGDGPVVLLAHAMMAGSNYLRPLADRIGAAGMVAWRVDLRGHGASPPYAGEADWSSDDHIDFDLPAAARAVRRTGRPLWLVGHSLGGWTGLAAEARHGPLFDGIIVVASGLWGPLSGCEAPRHWVRSAALSASVPLVHLLGRLPARTFGLGADEPPTYWSELADWSRRGTWRARDGFDYLRAVRGLELPVIGFRGERDRLVRPADHRRLLCMPGARFECIRNAGHFTVVQRGAKRIVEVLCREAGP